MPIKEYEKGLNKESYFYDESDHKFCCTKDAVCLHSDSIAFNQHAYAEFANLTEIKYLLHCPFCGKEAGE